MIDTKLVGGAALAASLMAAGHWFPLSEPWKPSFEDRRIRAYIYGIAGIAAGLYIATDLRTTLRMLTVAGGAGAATKGAYLIDLLLRKRKWASRTH